MKCLRHLCSVVIAMASTPCLQARAQAQPQPACQLERLAALPITAIPDGRFTIPVLIGRHLLNFLVDTGGAVATIASEQAFNLQLSTRTTESELRGVGGVVLNEVARPDSFSLGRLQGKGLPMYLDPRLPAGADGTLSPDMMSHYDVDIDIAGGTLSLFSQKHCPGQVVYWTKTGHVVLPMTMDGNGHIEVPLLVDGKEKMDAILDTGAMTSVISMRAAKALGITEKSPELKLISDKSLKYQIYSYPFKSLDFDGIAVSNPSLLVASNNFLPGRTEMIIGIGILRQLHLYVAYGEQKLYITPALAK